MTIADLTPKSETSALTFELDLAHPPQKVWRALTEPELLARWLLPTIGLDLTPGAAFTLKTDPQPGWDGVVDCRVLAVDPYKGLSYAWVVGDIDTVVTFSLDETARGTKLTIVQSGFREDQKRNFGGARYGWRMMTEKLVAVLDDPS
ncbi:MAG: SRPBCC domain-containing protein [Myxococcales bacterium]|nr:SRPBCC domain-containing protein [Myxococcales bacterium]MCB9734011.1 SRPBCC domain-containing protein [Deltaproteobacteria bacterium]